MSKHTIRLKDYVGVYLEKNAANDGLFPGKMLEVNTSDQVQEHSGASSAAIPMFALEDELQGNGIDDTYSSGDPVQVWIPHRGDEVYAVLADGENVSIGDKLESDGNGSLQGGTTAPVAEAIEALDLSGSSGEEDSGVLGYDKRIMVRVL
jgi:hypothetical protein